MMQDKYLEICLDGNIYATSNDAELLTWLAERIKTVAPFCRICEGVLFEQVPWIKFGHLKGKGADICAWFQYLLNNEGWELAEAQEDTFCFRLDMLPFDTFLATLDVSGLALV